MIVSRPGSGKPPSGFVTESPISPASKPEIISSINGFRALALAKFSFNAAALLLAKRALASLEKSVSREAKNCSLVSWL